jgi:glycosyltransferase involved in cell wall biosynthesis
LKKFAILSHILPPSPSGQAIILYRLLKELDPDSYYLISDKVYSNLDQNTIASSKLDSQYYALSDTPFKDKHKHQTINTIKNKLSPYPILYSIARRLAQLRAQVILILSFIRVTHQRSDKVSDILQQNPTQMLLTCTGDMSDLPAAYFACRKAKVKFVPYIFDDYVHQWTGLAGFIVRLFAWCLFKQADHIIVTNEVMGKVMTQRYGVDTKIIRNLCPIPDLAHLASEPIFEPDTINIIYAGAIYVHQDALSNLVKAIEQVNNPRIRLHLYTLANPDALKAQGIAGVQVELHPYIPQKEVFGVLRQADILFLPLAFETHVPEIVKTASPGKMGEYMALERPILVHAPADSFISSFFREYQCGVVVDENDTDKLAKALETTLSDDDLQMKISQNARQIARNEFALDAVRQQFEAFVDTLIIEN